MVAPVASRSTNDKRDLVDSVLVESAEPMNKGLVSRRNSTKAIIAADDEAGTVRKPHWLERTKLVEPSRPDLSTPIGEVESLLVRLDAGSDVAIGSRAVPGSALKVRQPWYREFAGRSFNRLARRLATPGLRDTQCGFKLFHRRAARDVFGRMVEDGFSFDIEALHLAIRLGYEIAEVPVRWTHQEGSKVRLLRDSACMFLAL